MAEKSPDFEFLEPELPPHPNPKIGGVGKTLGIVGNIVKLGHYVLSGQAHLSDVGIRSMCKTRNTQCHMPPGKGEVYPSTNRQLRRFELRVRAVHDVPIRNDVLTPSP